MELNWVVWGLIAMFGTSLWNISLMLPSDSIKSDSDLKFIYMRVILILAGVLAAISFLVPKFSLNNNLIKKAKREFNVPLVLFSSALLFIYQSLLLYAFASGGGLSIVLINLNTLLVVLFGVIFLKEKININIIIAMIIYVLVGGYISYEKNLLK